ncbi:hypothetical protein TIFTF001_006037 [Ficus carica]|uniref:Wax synthase domain-containing protein n=1 Tax=Ficus carica TaxID=3494 RepID=A0AA87ZZL7_FICCA|nr:hypothetical protein TIFTF001_006037 [Ficus carica]
MARYHPYFATSLQDFWGRRWNRMSSDILWQTVYDPTRESLAGVIGFGPAKGVAFIMTLVVSRAMHELIFYYITCGRKPTWEMAWFFVLHGLRIVMEAGLKRLARQKGWAPVNPAVFDGWVCDGHRFLVVGSARLEELTGRVQVQVRVGYKL